MLDLHRGPIIVPPVLNEEFPKGRLSAVSSLRGDDTRLSEELGHAVLADRLGFSFCW